MQIDFDTGDCEECLPGSFKKHLIVHFLFILLNLERLYTDKKPKVQKFMKNLQLHLS